MRDEGGEASGLANLEAALKVLHDAEVRVKTVVSQRFDEAVRDEDLASIERFFKIFPLIKMHDEGLRKFTNFLQDKVREKLGNTLTSHAAHSNTIPCSS